MAEHGTKMLYFCKITNNNFFLVTFVNLLTLFLQYPRTKTYMEVRNFTLTSQLLRERCETKRGVNPRHEKTSLPDKVKQSGAGDIRKQGFKWG